MRPLLFRPWWLALLITGYADRAGAACFSPGAELPTRQAVSADQTLSAAARDLAKALFDGRLDQAQGLLRADPTLSRRRVGAHRDMLSVAVATRRPEAVALIVRSGAPLNGLDDRGLPLRLALRAGDPGLAHQLLQAGASPNPRANPGGPLRTAITLNSLGAVRMLLDFGGDPNVMEATGNRPLHTALDMEHFRIAELLLDRGADAWAIDSGGANLGSSAVMPMVTRSELESEAQRRLAARLKRLGWPEPAPSPHQIRALALRGDWPPPTARAAGAAGVPAAVVALISANAERAK